MDRCCSLNGRGFGDKTGIIRFPRDAEETVGRRSGSKIQAPPWSSLDNIPPLETEMLCGGEEVFIVGMNLTKAVLLRASEVEGVRGTKENFCREDAEVL